GPLEACWTVPRYSARDDILAVPGSYHGTAFLDPSSGETVGTLLLDGVCPVGFDHAGNLLTAGKLGVCRWPRSVDPVEVALHFGPPQPLSSEDRPRQGACSADGSVIGVALWGQGFAIGHGSGQTIYKKPDANYCTVRAVDVSPDGRWVVNGAEAEDLKGVRIWDARSGELVKELPSGGYNHASFSPDGR